ncbi:MAG: winged helix-turn-helix transcriptional regulator [Magnetovibrio sp.]|nr:winged helix-turn-helix transcriptional regulator [Magnetovibrio sp.]
MTPDQNTELAEIFRLLGDANRLSIVLSCLDTPIGVGDLAKSLGLSQSLVSHHLRLLRAARLVRGERDGKFVRYVAADDHVRAMLKNMTAHIDEECGDD